MRTKAEETFYKQIGKVLTAQNKQSAQNELGSLLKIADILDQSGDTKGADHIDKVAEHLSSVIKTAQWWSSLLSGAGSALQSLWERHKEGEPLFSKQAVVDLVTKFLTTTGIGLLTDELVDVLESKLPVLNWFVGKDKINFVIKGALTYAVMHTDFVKGVVDGLEKEIGDAFGIKMEQNQQTQPNPQQTPTQQPSTTNEGSDAETFQVAPSA